MTFSSRDVIQFQSKANSNFRFGVKIAEKKIGMLVNCLSYLHLNAADGVVLVVGLGQGLEVGVRHGVGHGDRVGHRHGVGDGRGHRTARAQEGKNHLIARECID